MDNFTPLKTGKQKKKTNKILIFGNLFLIGIIVFISTFIVKDQLFSTQQKASESTATAVGGGSGACCGCGTRLDMTTGTCTIADVSCNSTCGGNAMNIGKLGTQQASIIATSTPTPRPATPTPTMPLPTATPTTVVIASLPTATTAPTVAATNTPTTVPTATTVPTTAPTTAATGAPTTAPTNAPTTAATNAPTATPTEIIVAKVSTSPTVIASLPVTGTIKSIMYIFPALIIIAGLIL